ncbi:FMP32, mitochondrial-like protein [Tanacetum coccineum]
MSAAIVMKRVVQLGLKNTAAGSQLKSMNSITSLVSSKQNSSLYDNVYRRSISSQHVNANGMRVCLVDTLALVRSLEAQGIPSKQAEAITSAITEVLNDSLENVADSFVSKADMEKTVMLQEANLSKFKSEVQSSQEHHFSMLQRETEKLRTDIDKMRSELRYEIDKVTAGQRLDLNLERGRIRDELANQNAETTNLTNKLDREIHGLRAQLEAAKYDVIKYCIGTLISISAVGLATILMGTPMASKPFPFDDRPDEVCCYSGYPCCDVYFPPLTDEDDDNVKVTAPSP